jgi:hypothetical protein
MPSDPKPKSHEERARGVMYRVLNANYADRVKSVALEFAQVAVEARAEALEEAANLEGLEDLVGEFATIEIRSKLWALKQKETKP